MPSSDAPSLAPLPLIELARLRASDVLKHLNSSPQGLASDEAARRLAEYGPNSLQQPKGPSLLVRLTRQFTHLLALLLWVAATLAFIAEALQPGHGMAMIGCAVIGVIGINAAFTFIQEYRAERAIEALRRHLPETSWVVRNGQSQQIARHDVVPGDIVLLEAGDQVPADARLLASAQLRVDLSALTGESHPSLRHSHPVPSQDLHPFDAPNLLFAGTTVRTGHGRVVVAATGPRTEFGNLVRLTTTPKPTGSPLQREIARLTHVIGLLAGLIGGMIFLAGVALGLDVWASVIVGIGIIVANVPEGLLPTVTLALAMGSQRLARRQALVTQLTSVETLGCTTVICTDKTGTLTEQRMRVDRLYVDGLSLEARSGHLVLNGRLFNMFDRKRLQPFFQALTLCNNARPMRRGERGVRFTGDPTDVALMEFAEEHLAAHGERAEMRTFPRMAELPFDSDRKRMTTLHWVAGGLTAYAKGAPESVLPFCSRTLSRGSTAPMTAAERKAVLAQSAQFADEAYRVLAVAMRPVESGIAESLSPEAVEQELIFLGLVALFDPPHREVPEAIARCRQAGIRVIMITGDHANTALAVGRKIGLVGEQGSAVVINGERLDALPDQDLHDLLRQGAASGPDRQELLFARMAPRHKLRVVAMLKQMGEVVAVTGAGVDDAPALKAADIGIAMGIAGTDVARATADIVLLDDNFASIVNAIEEGRTVYANIRKFLTYVLTHNVPQLCPYLASGLLPVPPALTIPQILAVDLGTDIVPALALGAEPPHRGIMSAPPRPRSERLLSWSLLVRAYVVLGLMEAGIALGAFFWFLHAQGWTWGTSLGASDPLYRAATTVTLAAIVVAQAANVWVCRSERTSILTLGVLTNRFVLWALVIELGLLALIVYTPIGQAILGTEPLPAWAWLPLLAGAAGLLLAEEGRKWLVRRMAA